MRPIAGGPITADAAAAAAQALKDEGTARSGDVVTEDIGRALDIVGSDPAWTTGIGALLKGIPASKAKSLGGILETVKANIGFDRLQQMRDSSVTGGALGAINTTEMDLLQAVLGNLDQSLSADDLVFNLNRINGIYMDIIHGKDNWNNPTPPPPEGGTQGMSDAELLEYYNQ